MLGQKRVVCVVPARLESSRFPRKILAMLDGRPLLEWVWGGVKRVTLFDDVVFAIDDPETAEVIDRFGGRSIMTDVARKSGTDRLVELIERGMVQADVVVGWQADEPFITPTMIYSLLQSCDCSDQEVWTLKKLIRDPSEIFSPHVVKVVCDAQGYALYFSRAPIPFFCDERDPGALATKKIYHKHIGLYAFTVDALKKISNMGASVIEDAERLEQLRYLEQGMRIRVHETDHEVIGINTPADFARAEEYVRTTLGKQ